MVLLLFLLHYLLSLTGGVPCNQAPENGHVTVTRDGIHVFSCPDPHYQLVGRHTALCVDQALNIPGLPSCVLKLPKTTNIKSTYNSIVCSQYEIERRKKVLNDYLMSADCVRDKTCIFKEMKHKCLPLDKILIETTFYVSSQGATADMARWASIMGQTRHSGSETRHSRKKRQFDDLVPDNTVTNNCDDGAGMSEDGESCLDCQPGQYGSNDVCIDCPIGQYSVAVKQTACIACAEGTTTLQTGTQQASACLVVCALPAATIHSQYTIDNKAVADGDNIADSTSVTLLCDSGYTFKGANKFIETCASNSPVFKNECFKVEASPTADLYQFTGGPEATVTCTGYSSFKPHAISYTKTGGAGFSITDVDAGTDTYNVDTDIGSARFAVTGSVAEQGAFTCTMQPYSAVAEVETSLSSTGVLLFKFEDPPATPTVFVGASVTISAVVTSHTNVGYTWSWKKGSDVYENANHIDKTDDGKNYKVSKTEITSAAFSDAGIYTISLSISNLEGLEKLVKEATSTLSVRGFSGQPADESGLTTVTRGLSSQVTLTCTFDGTLESDESIKWMEEDKSTDYSSDAAITVSNVPTSKSTKSTITFSSWPSYDNAKAYCMVFKGAAWQFSSDPVLLFSVDYSITITPDADTCGMAATDVKITCTASFPASITTGPTVTWYKVVADADDTVISDGTDYVVSGSKEGVTWESVLTVKAASSADAGSYYCKGIWTEPQYTPLTSTARTLTVVGLTDIALQYALVGASNVQFSTTYTGQKPLSVSWKDPTGNAIDNNAYPHTTDFSAASGPYTFTLTVPSVSSTTLTQFDIVVTPQPPCTDVSATITTSAKLEILSAAMTTTATQFQVKEDYVYEGGSVSLTCTYKNPQSLTTPTVTWVATGADGTTPINVGTPDTSAASSSPEGNVVITLSTATITGHSGTYKCEVLYPNSIGTASSETRTLYVIGFTPAATVYIGEGGSGKLTCTFKGRTGTVTWTQSGASGTDLTSRVTTGIYGNGEITSELSFTNAQHGTDEGQYNCVMTYQNIADTKTLQPWLRIMRATEVAVTPTTGIADSGSGFTLSCKVSWDVSDLSYNPAVTWTFTGTDGTPQTLTNQANQFQYSKPSATSADMGKYKCSIDFNGSPSVAENTLYFRSIPTLTIGVEDAATNLVSPSTVLLGHPVTFTCTLSGDATGVVQWYKGSDVIADSNLYDFSTKTDTTYGATTTVTIKAVPDGTPEGDYTCKSTYTSDSVATESSPVTLEVLGATGVTSSKQYADKGDDVTLVCSYLELSGDATPAAWIVPGVTTPVPNPNTATESTVAVTGATFANTGDAKCTVTYSNALTNFVSITQYVRGVEFQNLVGSKVYGLNGKVVDLKCILYGDELNGVVTWAAKGSDISITDEADNKTPATTPYNSVAYTTTSTLTITAATVATDGTTYTCKGTRKHDSVVSQKDQELTIVTMSITGTTTVNLGGDTTLACTTTPSDDLADSYSWKKGVQVVDGQTAASLPLTGVTFEAAVGYTCVIVFKHALGTMESAPATVFVQGFVSLVQENMSGDYNEAGETITIRAVIRSQAKPETFTLQKTGDAAGPTAITNSPDATQDGDWTVDVEFEAKAVSVADGQPKNAVYTLSIGTMSGVESEITLTIYVKCPLPTVTSLTALQGGSLDHKGVLSDFTCTGGKSVSGGTGVSCEDGTLTWTGTSPTQPECIDLAVATNPAPQLVEVGSKATLSCSSTATALTVSKVVWYSAADTVEEDTDPASTGTAGSLVFTSTLELTGAPELDGKTYECKLVTDDAKEVTSTTATVYIVGVKSGVATYPGDYFESDAQAGEFSETASIKFEVYDGPGIATAAVSLKREGQSDAVLTFVAGTEQNNLVPYAYTIADSLKVTGTYQIKVTYQDVADAVGNKEVKMDLLLPVYQFCKIAELPTVAGGTWSPATKVDFRGYATLTCGSGNYLNGNGVTQCLPGSAKTAFAPLDPTPTCDSKEDLLKDCGALTEPEHGSVFYRDTNSASYLCDAGYYLIGAQTEYTCNAATGSWSIVTAENPNGNPPICQATIAAESRYADVTLSIAVDGVLCLDDGGKQLVSTALKSALETEGIVKCTKDFYCTWIEFTCTYQSSPKSISVGFKLKQTISLKDKTLVSDDVERIKAKGPSVIFQVTIAKKKRATVNADVTTAIATTVSACPSGSIDMDGTCSLCPAGYGLSDTTCSPCALGHYSVGDTINSCSVCSGGLTTLLTGSTVSSDCIASGTVCTVETDVLEHTTLVPPGGARISPDAYVSMTCGTGYNLAVQVQPTFRCSTNPYPLCYLQCSLAEYTDTVLAERYIHNTNIEEIDLRHNEKISVTCMAGYEYDEDTPLKIQTCVNGVLPDFGTCVRQSGGEVLTTVIVCVIVLGVAVILLFLFIIVQWRKKKQAVYTIRGRKRFADPIENIGVVEEEGLDVQMKKVSLKLSEADKKAPLMSRPVHISDFSKYYDLLTRNDDRELKQEFSTFDSFDDNNTCYHGSIPENDGKNRYKNIIPFDHSRVKLSIINDDVHSDYINASYIHGYHKPRVFIATQAPLYETLEEFWRMVWEKKSTMIVNLTKVEENGKLKSIVYWPSVEEHFKQYGTVSVTRVDKQESEFFVVYSFEIRHKLEDGCREVFMFNYVGWPDFDVPTRTAEFVNFIYNIRHLLFIRPPMGPIVCHCSAGTGRTGAYIGIMNTLDRLINKEDLDILGLVGSLRQQRRKMVFTNTQYKFLHRVMLDVVTNDNFDLLKQSGFRKKIDVPGVTENPYVSTSESDELDDLNDTKV